MNGEDKRLYLLAGLASIIVVIALGTWFMLQAKMEPVMREASESQLALAIHELTNAHIPYRVDEEGMQLMVGEDDAARARSLIADLGLPFDQSIGLESFENSDFGVTEFAQQINYKRALEGELVRTISSLKEVRYARVHLVLPEKGILQSKEVPASAAVTLFLREGAKLSEQQIQGIRRLVSASVPKLEAETVSILDQNGIALDAPDIDGNHGYSSVMRIRQDIESALERRIVEILELEFGPGTVYASVNAELDLDEITRRREELIADADGQGKLVSSKKSKTYSSDKNKKANENDERQYAYGRLIEEVIVKPGAIGRLSAAVSLRRPLSEQQNKDIYELIGHAIGVSAERGDRLFVHAFGGSDQDDPGTQEGQGDLPIATQVGEGRKEALKGSLTSEQSAVDLFRQYWYIGLVLLLLAAILVVIARSASRTSLSAEQREELLGEIKQWLQN